MSKILVTGGAGFIGSNLVMKLLEMKHDVWVLDNFSSGFITNLVEVAANPNLHIFHGDVINFETCVIACLHADYVFHLAAIPAVQDSVDLPITTNSVNIGGTLNILEAARRCQVKRVIFASSSAVYGNSPESPKQEWITKDLISPYAVQKFAGEKYCRLYSELYNLDTAVLRFFNVYGPRQNPNSEYSAVIPKFIKLMKAGSPPTFYGDGSQTRDFIYVDDLVWASIMVMNAPISIRGEPFNVGRGVSISVKILFDVLSRIMGYNGEEIIGERIPGDPLHSIADVSKIKRIFGFEALIDIKSGLDKTVEFFTKGGSKNVTG